MKRSTILILCAVGYVIVALTALGGFIAVFIKPAWLSPILGVAIVLFFGCQSLQLAHSKGRIPRRLGVYYPSLRPARRPLEMLGRFLWWLTVSCFLLAVAMGPVVTLARDKTPISSEHLDMVFGVTISLMVLTVCVGSLFSVLFAERKRADRSAT